MAKSGEKCDCERSLDENENICKNCSRPVISGLERRIEINEKFTLGIANAIIGKNR